MPPIQTLSRPALVLLAVLALCFHGCSKAPLKVALRDLSANPAQYYGKNVEVEGICTNIQPTGSGAAHEPSICVIGSPPEAVKVLVAGPVIVSDGRPRVLPNRTSLRVIGRFTPSMTVNGNPEMRDVIMAADVEATGLPVELSDLLKNPNKYRSAPVTVRGKCIRIGKWVDAGDRGDVCTLTDGRHELDLLVVGSAAVSVGDKCEAQGTYRPDSALYKGEKKPRVVVAPPSDLRKVD